jgi:hypothetical protein
MISNVLKSYASFINSSFIILSKFQEDHANSKCLDLLDKREKLIDIRIAELLSWDLVMDDQVCFVKEKLNYFLENKCHYSRND